MKKALSLFAIAGILSFGALQAQESATAQPETTMADSAAPAESVSTTEVAATESTDDAAPVAEPSFTQEMKRYFIEGDPVWMSPVLLVLILGLALVIERILYLTFSISNNEKLLVKVEDALNSGGIEAAKEVCRNERGPVATLFYEGLDHYDEGLDMVDKSIVAVGSVENGKLEKGMSWISLFIALAPMLGFLGTVIGMIFAFDSIEQAGNISPTLVAGGIKVALLTTVFGLIVAIILQIFYNLIVSMIESIVNKMEDASISFLDMLVDYSKKNK